MFDVNPFECLQKQDIDLHPHFLYDETSHEDYSLESSLTETDTLHSSHSNGIIPDDIYDKTYSINPDTISYINSFDTLLDRNDNILESKKVENELIEGNNSILNDTNTKKNTKKRKSETQLPTEVKPKRSTPLTEDEKLTRNREAARKFRKKQQIQLKELKERVKFLENENRSLFGESNRLKTENSIKINELNKLYQLVQNLLNYTFNNLSPQHVEDIQNYVKNIDVNIC